MPSSKFYDIQPEAGRLALRGEWIMDNALDLDAELKNAANEKIRIVDASGLEKIDLWGALRIRQMAGEAELILDDKQKRIFEFLPDKPSTDSDKPFFQLSVPFITLGKAASAFVDTALGLLSFIGEIFICGLRNLRHPSKFRLHSIVRHIDETGFRALPIIALLAVLISMVISYQAATQLTKFGANIFTVDLTVISLLREMAVLITAIMVAGRSGSAFAAEIGVMKLREEVDALRTMGFNPIEVLVLPRLIALMITLPLLTFMADLVGLAGGSAIAVLLLDIPLDQYIERVQSVAKPMMFFVGIIKAPVFAFAIAIIGTYQGMNVSGSAESVGKLTTLSVVQSIFLVIMLDALFSILFANLGI